MPVPRDRHDPRRRPAIEQPSCQPLEGRRLLTAPLMIASVPAFPAPGARVTVTGNALAITGTARADELALAADPSGRVTLNGQVLLRHRKPVAAASLRSILVHAGAGGDRVDLRAVTPDAFPRLARAVVFAGDGADSVLGSAFSDLIDGGAGNDTVRGMAGDDLLFGRDQVDFLLGNDGDDRLLGGGDTDVLYGGAGDDLLRGEAGADELCAAGSIEEDADLPDPPTDDEGADTLDGGAGSDRYFLLGSGAGRFTFREAPRRDRDELNAAVWDHPLDLDLASTAPQSHAGPGRWLRFTDAEGFEAVVGTAHDDVLHGNARPNSLDGLNGSNLIVGRDGDDTLLGGADGDTLRGEGGDDQLYPGPGDDLVVGGAGSDTYRWPGAYEFGRDAVVEAPDADSDTLDFSESAGPVTLDLGTTVEQPVLGIGGMGLRLTLSSETGLEDVLTSRNGFFNWADQVRGNARPNRIATFHGDDAVDVAGDGGGGAATADTVFAGAGNDAVTADPDDEVLADADPPA